MQQNANSQHKLMSFFEGFLRLTQHSTVVSPLPVEFAFEASSLQTSQQFNKTMVSFFSSSARICIRLPVSSFSRGGVLFNLGARMVNICCPHFLHICHIKQYWLLCRSCPRLQNQGTVIPGIFFTWCSTVSVIHDTVRI